MLAAIEEMQKPKKVAQTGLYQGKREKRVILSMIVRLCSNDYVENSFGRGTRNRANVHQEFLIKFTYTKQ